MFASQTQPRVNVRLSAAVKAWVAQEAAARKCPMNTVILDALTMTMNQALSEQLSKKHDAAVKLAISIAQLPKGTAIVLQTEQHDLRTDILVREPLQTNYSILARVHGEEVAFADDIARDAQRVDGKLADAPRTLPRPTSRASCAPRSRRGRIGASRSRARCSA